jgi:hypothetical protein
MPAFDRRPGALEATRGLAWAGSTAARCGIAVIGSRDAGGWQVLAAVTGERGEFCQVALTPEEARAAAAELIEMANVLDGTVW